MADYIYMVQLEIPDEHEDEFNRIYDTQHIPYLLTVPGVQGCARYRLESSGAEGVARYVAIYEIDSPDLPESPAWKEQSDKGDWVTQIRPHVTSRIRSVYRQLG